MNALPPDAASLCAMLGLGPQYLSDVFRREVAYQMRALADRVPEVGRFRNVPEVETISQLLLLIDELEIEWEHQHKESSDGAVARNGGDSPTQPPLPSREGTLA